MIQERKGPHEKNGKVPGIGAGSGIGNVPFKRAFPYPDSLKTVESWKEPTVPMSTYVNL